MFLRVSLLFALTIYSFSFTLAKNESTSKSGTSSSLVKELPYPKNFNLEKYLGKWYEVARLPAPNQPKGSVAIAKYSKSKNKGEILVENTACKPDGQKLASIQGKAKVLEGKAPRLAVSFGSVIPNQANYHVIHVDKGYKHAIVGNPDRNSLWILSRKVPVPEKKLNKLIKRAKNAGFDTQKLIINSWKLNSKNASPEKQSLKHLLGTWTYEYGQRNGKKFGKDHYAGRTIEITKDKLILKGKMPFVLSHRINFKNDPPTIELKIEEGPFGIGSSTAGIIMIKKGKLHFCYSPRGAEPPKKFEAADGSGHAYFVLNKVKNDKAGKLTHKKMVGTWSYQSAIINGKSLDENRLKKSEVKITKDKLHLLSEQFDYVLSYHSDFVKQPASLKMKILEGPFGVGSEAHGIAKFEKGHLYLCYNSTGPKAPIKFESKEGSGYSLIVLKMKKAIKEDL